MKWLLKIKMNNDCVINIRGVEYGFDVEYVECIIPDGDIEEQQRKVVEFLSKDVIVHARGYYRSMCDVLQETSDRFNYNILEDLSWYCGGARSIEVVPYIEPIVI